MAVNWLESYTVFILKHGGVAIHATEGVFGFAGAYWSAEAAGRIATLKGRDPSTSPFLLIAASVEQITDIVTFESPLLDEIKTSWPGPITWIFSIKTGAYDWIGGADGSLAVRVTAHPQAQLLCRQVGPLISTSANRHGEDPILDIDSARRDFGSDVDVYLPGRLLTPGRPSQIRDARSGDWLRR